MDRTTTRSKNQQPRVLMAGDVILCRGAGLLDFLIRAGQAIARGRIRLSPYSHAAICLSNGIVIDALPMQPLGPRRLKDWLNDVKVDASVVYRHPDTQVWDQSSAIDETWIESQRNISSTEYAKTWQGKALVLCTRFSGLPYNWSFFSIKKTLKNGARTTAKRFYCSEFVVAVCRDIDPDHFNDVSSKSLPIDLPDMFEKKRWTSYPLADFTENYPKYRKIDLDTEAAGMKDLLSKHEVLKKIIDWVDFPIHEEARKEVERLTSSIDDFIMSGGETTPRMMRNITKSYQLKLKLSRMTIDYIGGCQTADDYKKQLAEVGFETNFSTVFTLNHMLINFVQSWIDNLKRKVHVEQETHNDIIREIIIADSILYGIFTLCAIDNAREMAKHLLLYPDVLQRNKKIIEAEDEITSCLVKVNLMSKLISKSSETNGNIPSREDMDRFLTIWDEASANSEFTENLLAKIDPSIRVDIKKYMHINSAVLDVILIDRQLRGIVSSLTFESACADAAAIEKVITNGQKELQHLIALQL